MNIREQQESFEEEYLSPYASLSKNSAGRDVPEQECDMRTVYQRDRDRIIHCRAFRASGACRVSGDVEAETAVLSGAVEIGGLLNAETVEISANRAVHISAIGGGTIRVLQKDTATVLGIFHTSPGCARIGSIEGDNVELENVEAEIVRGKYVRIGHGCRIGTVEYGENLEAEPGTVGHSTQTGTK